MQDKPNPKQVIEAYREKISNKNSDIQEPSSFNQIAMRSEDIPKMLVAIDNYSKALKLTTKKPEKLFFFIRDGIYLDYQVEAVENQTKKAMQTNQGQQSKQDKTKAFIDDYYKRKAEAQNNVDGNIIDTEVM